MLTVEAGAGRPGKRGRRADRQVAAPPRDRSPSRFDVVTPDVRRVFACLLRRFRSTSAGIGCRRWLVRDTPSDVTVP